MFVAKLKSLISCGCGQCCAWQIWVLIFVAKLGSLIMAVCKKVGGSQSGQL